MLDLSESQAKIIKVMIEIVLNTETKNEGFSSYEIRKHGIPGRTFDINRNFLLRYQLIKIVDAKKTGKQTRTYYSVTPLGFFTFLKGLEKSYINSSIKKYGSSIGTHWDNLCKLYGDITVIILKKTIDQINLEPVKESLSIFDNIFPGSELEETSTISFEEMGLRISLVRRYHTFSDENISSLESAPKKGNPLLRYGILNHNQLSSNVIERFVFLFFFNLLKLKYDFVYSYTIVLELTRSNSPKALHTDKFLGNYVSLDSEEGKRKMKRSLDIFNTHINKMEKLSEYAFSLIKNDSELYRIFSKNFIELDKKFDLPIMYKFLKKEFG